MKERSRYSAYGEPETYIVHSDCSTQLLAVPYDSIRWDCKKVLNHVDRVVIFGIQKSNEITAIPALLDVLAIQGCVITIDAMGCQRGIVQKIINLNADYILKAKDNQKNFLRSGVSVSEGKSAAGTPRMVNLKRV